MTFALCLASFLAGAAVTWARSRNAIAQARREAYEMLFARHVAELEIDLAEAIRLGEGA